VLKGRVPLASAVFFSRKLGVIVKYLTAIFCIVFACSFQTAMASSVSMQLEFDGLSVSDPSVLELDGATITHGDGGKIFVYESGAFGMPAPGGFCALQQIGRNPPNCKSDATLVFDNPVSDLSFETFFVSGGDQANVSIIIDGIDVPDINITSNQVVDLSAWVGITELRFIDASGASDAGLAYGRFTYSLAVIPLPAMMPPFAFVLFFLSFGRFRRNRRLLRGSMRPS
jgi:hypothetical protein